MILQACSLNLVWLLHFSCGMGASSLVVEGDLCLIAMCGNAPSQLACSGGCSLVVARGLLSRCGKVIPLFDGSRGMYLICIGAYLHLW